MAFIVILLAGEGRRPRAKAGRPNPPGTALYLVPTSLPGGVSLGEPLTPVSQSCLNTLRRT